jgi:hypothetical protein
MDGNDMAFPCLDENFTPNGSIQVGLTKREWFAGMALQGLAAGAQASGSGADMLNCEAMALDAIALADAVLKEMTQCDASDEHG